MQFSDILDILSHHIVFCGMPLLIHALIVMAIKVNYYRFYADVTAYPCHN